MELFIQVELRIKIHHCQVILLIDIKPENFIMTSGGQLRIIDLGLSFRISPTQSSVLRPFAGEIIGIFFF
jgi:serine/threonine protein kinase